MNTSVGPSMLARFAGVAALAGLAATLTTAWVAVFASPMVQVLSQIATVLL